MLVVNLYGAPGAGKSAITSGLFEKMKIAGINCEISLEYAKRLVRHGRKLELLNQSYVTNKQYHKLFMLKGQVDVVITDAPLPMGLVYAPDDYPQWYTDMVWDFHRQNRNVNFYINRVGKYEIEGRQQNEEESDLVGYQIKKMLSDNDLRWTNFDANDCLTTQTVDLTSRKILDHIIGTGYLDGIL